jgi:hypothetical protein
MIDISWCDSCDARLYEKRDGSMICSNPVCGRTYLPDSVQKHKRKMSPDKSYTDIGAPELVSMTNFTNTKKKTETIMDKEERLMAQKKSGFSWTNIEEWLPE